MFDDEELPVGVTWDRKKVHEFRMEQDRLSEEGSCVSTSLSVSTPVWLPLDHLRIFPSPILPVSLSF